MNINKLYNLNIFTIAKICTEFSHCKNNNYKEKKFTKQIIFDKI